MLVNYTATISAFVEAVAWRRRASPPSTPQDVKAASQFFLKVQQNMPTHLRIPFHVLTLVFDGWAYFTDGKPFHRLNPARRLAQTEAWQRSQLETRRRYVEFCTSLAIFGLYSEIYSRDYQPTVPDNESVHSA
jgi:hypothetical protein